MSLDDTYRFTDFAQIWSKLNFYRVARNFAGSNFYLSFEEFSATGFILLNCPEQIVKMSFSRLGFLFIRTLHYLATEMVQVGIILSLCSVYMG